MCRNMRLRTFGELHLFGRFIVVVSLEQVDLCRAPHRGRPGTCSIGDPSSPARLLVFLVVAPLILSTQVGGVLGRPSRQAHPVPIPSILQPCSVGFYVQWYLVVLFWIVLFSWLRCRAWVRCGAVRGHELSVCFALSRCVSSLPLLALTGDCGPISCCGITVETACSPFAPMLGIARPGCVRQLRAVSTVLQ